MAETEDDELYFDAISTGDLHGDDKYATAKPDQGFNQTPISTDNYTKKKNDSKVDIPHVKMKQASSSLPQSGQVANLIHKFKGHDYHDNVQPVDDISAINPTISSGNGHEENKPSLNNAPYTGVNAPYPGDNAPYPGGNAPYTGVNAPYPGYNSPYPGDNAGTYSFAKDISPQNDIPSDKPADFIPNIDLFGYSHAMKEAQRSHPVWQPGDVIHSSTHSTETVVAPNHPEENLYDSVKRTSEEFEIINHDDVSGSSIEARAQTMEPASSRTGEKEMMKKMVESLNYDWKRKEAKKKTKALKRPTKSDKGGNPFTQHSMLDDPHDGAIPEAEDEALGHVCSPFTQHTHHHKDNDDHHHHNNDDDDSCSSIFTDSTFDTMSSDTDNLDEEDFFPNKPLPPKPEKHSQLKDLKQKVLPSHTKKDLVDESPVLEPVMLRRPRTPPLLPANQGSITQNQVKLRGVLQSLIDSETNYIKSLERLRDVYKETILSLTKKPEVRITFQKVEEIISIHKMFQIEFSEKLKKWNSEERIGTIFHVFSQRMVVNIYSEYVNNYEAASETIKELENSKQNFKEFLKKSQMESDDRLSLAGLMLKPVQRFPQFIMIIKDLLKYTPRDHHDREQLQEAVTWIENVAHQLNERKRQSEQFYHGNQIMSKLPPRGHMEKNLFLIRQDDMEQHSQDQNGSQFIKLRRLFLMNDRLVSVHVPQR